MQQFTFRLNHESDAILDWRKYALSTCLAWKPLPGSPGILNDEIFHFFYFNSIRGVMVVKTDDQNFSLVLGSFASSDDIFRVSELLEAALLRGITIHVTDSEEPLKGAEVRRTLVDFLLSGLTDYDKEFGESYQLSQVGEKFIFAMKCSCWKNYLNAEEEEEEEEEEDAVWVKIVDHTYSLKLEKQLLKKSQSEVERFMVKEVTGVMNTDFPVMIKNFYEFWRPATGVMAISEYTGEACYVSLQCSHIDLTALDERFNGKIITIGNMYRLLQESSRMMGLSVFLPSILGTKKEQILERIAIKAVEIPPLF